MKRGDFIRTGLLGAGVLAIPSWAQALTKQPGSVHVVLSCNGGLRISDLNADTAIVNLPNSLHHHQLQWIKTGLLNSANAHHTAALLAKQYTQVLTHSNALSEWQVIEHAHLASNESNCIVPQYHEQGLLLRDKSKLNYVVENLNLYPKKSQWLVQLNATDLAHTSARMYSQSLLQLDEGVAQIEGIMKQNDLKGTIHIVVPVIRNEQENDCGGYDHSTFSVEITSAIRSV